MNIINYKNEIVICQNCDSAEFERFGLTEIYECKGCHSKRLRIDWERQKGTKKADIFGKEKEGLFG